MNLNIGFVPEILVPAGSLEKLKIAVTYGADAVYIGGPQYGLRSAASNFEEEEIIEAIAFAHQHQALVYMVLNSFLHDDDFKGLDDFILFLVKFKCDALIISDLGVLDYVQQRCNIPIHLSTQASCLNQYSAQLWKKMGVSRIVLGREVSIAAAEYIKESVGIELEMFIHGSMCMAYSGNCVISNYTQGRDSNRGGCAHSCRFEYSLESSNTITNKANNSYFMSSKDLKGIEHISAFADAKIDSLKIEGRMKGPYYVASVTNAYSKAIKALNMQDETSKLVAIKDAAEDLDKIIGRSHTDANLVNKANADSIFNEREHEKNPYAVAGIIRECVVGKFAILEVRSQLKNGEGLEVLIPGGRTLTFVLETLQDIYAAELNVANPGRLIKIKYLEGMQKWCLVRKGPVI